MQIDPYPLPCTKLKFKRIKDLNLNPVTLNLTEKKWEVALNACMGTEDHFLNITPEAQTLRVTINKRDSP